MQKLSRRQLLKVMGIGSAGALLAACAAPAAPPASAPTAASGDAAGGTTEQPAPTTAPAAGAPVKLTFIESWFGVPQFKESIDPITKALSEKAKAEGLNAEFTSMLLDDHETKYPALYASGADFTMAFDAPWYKMTTLRAQNALVTLEGLFDQFGQKLKEEVTEPIYKANFVGESIFGIPTAYYYGGTGGVIFREDLRAKYNAPMPTSEAGWTSLEPFLEAVMKNEKGVIPFGNVTTQSMAGYSRNRLSWAPGATKTGITIVDATKEWKIVDEEDNQAFIDNAKTLRGWWEKGYINKTDLTFSGSSQNAQIDYVYPGKIAACVENEPDYKWVDQNKQMGAAIPGTELRGMDMTGMRAGTKGLGALKQWNFVVFNASAPKEAQEAGMKWFNWLVGSQDNIDLWLMGVDGTNYKKEDNLRFSEVAGADPARNYRRQWYVSGVSGRFQRQPKDLPPEAEEALKFFSAQDNWVFNPHEQFEPDVKALEVESAKLNAVYDEAVHGLNTGQMPTDEAVAKLKQMLNDAGRQEYKAKLQKQLDDFIAAKK
jgi:putative aldouronate transport system substrate-binding protein